MKYRRGVSETYTSSQKRDDDGIKAHRNSVMFSSHHESHQAQRLLHQIVVHCLSAKSVRLDTVSRRTIVHDFVIKAVKHFIQNDYLEQAVCSRSELFICLDWNTL